jgi:virginiamycin A acetyltransferase
MNTPNPMVTHPVPGFPVTYVKPTITRPNIVVGEFTYYSGLDFQACVTHHYEFYGDKLIIGKFCQIASGVEFIMNGTNHKMNAASTFPFYILEGWEQETPSLSELPCKGDTIIGNDVWIGQNATILPGVHIGNGAIIGASSVVGSNVEPYTIVAGNPAKPIRKRFDDELTALLEKFKWWDKSADEIQTLIPLLSDSDLERVKRELKERLR